MTHQQRLKELLEEIRDELRELCWESRNNDDDARILAASSILESSKPPGKNSIQNRREIKEYPHITCRKGEKDAIQHQSTRRRG